jgi:hypothetical protein
MKPEPPTAHVHPFPIRHADGPDNSVFAQEAEFSLDDQGRLAAPFSCFPPFRGESPFVVARGTMVLTEDARRRVEELARDMVEAMLAAAIRKKLPGAVNGELVIELADLPIAAKLPRPPE